MKEFVKKYWKQFAITAGLGLSFLAFQNFSYYNHVGILVHESCPQGWFEWLDDPEYTGNSELVLCKRANSDDADPANYQTYPRLNGPITKSCPTGWSDWYPNAWSEQTRCKRNEIIGFEEWSTNWMLVPNLLKTMSGPPDPPDVLAISGNDALYMAMKAETYVKTTEGTIVQASPTQIQQVIQHPELFLNVAYMSDTDTSEYCPSGWSQTALFFDGTVLCHKDGTTGLGNPDDWMTLLPPRVIPGSPVPPPIGPVDHYPRGGVPWNGNNPPSDFPMGGNPGLTPNAEIQSHIRAIIQRVSARCPIVGSFLAKMPVYMVYTDEGYIGRIHVSENYPRWGNFVDEDAYIILNARVVFFTKFEEGGGLLFTSGMTLDKYTIYTSNGLEQIEVVLVHEALHEILRVFHKRGYLPAFDPPDEIYRHEAALDCGEPEWGPKLRRRF